MEAGIYYLPQNRWTELVFLIIGLLDTQKVPHPSALNIDSAMRLYNAKTFPFSEIHYACSEMMMFSSELLQEGLSKKYKKKKKDT